MISSDDWWTIKSLTVMRAGTVSQTSKVICVQILRVLSSDECANIILMFFDCFYVIQVLSLGLRRGCILEHAGTSPAASLLRRCSPWPGHRSEVRVVPSAFFQPVYDIPGSIQLFNVAGNISVQLRAAGSYCILALRLMPSEYPLQLHCYREYQQKKIAPFRSSPEICLAPSPLQHWHSPYSSSPLPLLTRQPFRLAQRCLPVQLRWR